MLNTLFINACILIAIISMVFQIYHNQKKYFINHPLLSKIILGIFAGLSGIVMFPIHLLLIFEISH